MCIRLPCPGLNPAAVSSRCLSRCYRLVTGSLDQSRCPPVTIQLEGGRWGDTAGSQSCRARRERPTPTHFSADETSFRKGHDYVTVVTDQDSGHILHVADDRIKTSLESFYDGLAEAQKSAVDSVAMDMWSAYINMTLAVILDAREKIAFGKFHVAKYLREAVDKVRKQEHRILS